MTDGVVVELKDLISLQKLARAKRYRQNSYALNTGSHLSKLRGRGMDFTEARNYQPGDEIRHMEWRVTARTGRPHVKVYQEERECPVVILTDFNSSMYFGSKIAFKSVIASRLAALIAWTAANQGDRVGGLVFSANSHHEFVPRCRQAGVLPLLASLSNYTYQYHYDHKKITNPCSLSQAILRLGRVAKPGSILVLISDFYNMDLESEGHLRRLSRHNNILAYHICDPLELGPPKPGQYSVTDGRQEIILDTTLDSVRLAYQFYCDHKISELKAKCHKLEIQYMQVTSSTDLPQLVHNSFPRRTCGS